MVETIRQTCGDTSADGTDAAGGGGGRGCGQDGHQPYQCAGVSADFAFAEDADLLEIIFPQILDCDAAFLRCGGETMLIDCATSGQAQRILNMFKQLGITHVDKIVNTHPARRPHRWIRGIN